MTRETTFKAIPQVPLFDDPAITNFCVAIKQRLEIYQGNIGSGSDVVLRSEFSDLAELNVNADWNTTSDDALILNKPTDITDLSGHFATELSDITNVGSGAIITTIERTKLSGIEDGATADQTGSEIVALINAGGDLIDDDNIAASICRDSEAILQSLLTTQGDIVVRGVGVAERLAAGADGKVLTSTGPGSMPAWEAIVGDGDVVGPASATDNAICRFNLTTGKIIQNSNAIIDDAGTMKISDDFMLNNSKYILCENTSGLSRYGLGLYTNNDWHIARDGRAVSIGYGCSLNNPIMIRIDGADDQTLRRSYDTDSYGNHYVVVT